MAAWSREPDSNRRHPGFRLPHPRGVYRCTTTRATKLAQLAADCYRKGVKKVLEPKDILNPTSEMFLGEFPRIGSKTVSPQVSWSTVDEALSLDQHVIQKHLVRARLANACSDVKWAVLFEEFISVRKGKEVALRLPFVLKPNSHLLIWTSPPVDRTSIVTSVHTRVREVGFDQCAYRPAVWVVPLPPEGQFADDWHKRAMERAPDIGPGKLPNDEHLENRTGVWRAAEPRSRILISIRPARSLPVTFEEIRLLCLLQPMR